MKQVSIENGSELAGQQQGKTSHFLRSWRLRATLCFACLGAVAGVSLAADPVLEVAKTKEQSPIAINLKQFKVVENAQGETKFEDAGLVLPGDVVEYRATYANRSNASLPVVATMPIPDVMEYIKDSAKAATGHTVATKNSQYATEPLMQKVISAGGATLSQPVPYASYRFVRWDLGRLSPGSSVDVSVRARVSQDLERDVTAADKSPLQVSSSIQK